MPKETLKDKLDGNELDLSLSNLSVVPVKDLTNLPKATHLDLSCNLLTSLPSDFCTLKHIVRLDLSKNKLKVLPQDFGSLQRLQHLDLLGNELEHLPVSFGYLKNLRWLDVKDNPLDEKLKKVAGDCLDDLQCKRCASNMIAFMKSVQSEQERKKQKRLEEERALEAVRKAEEEKERQQKKKEKQAEKERRRKEYEAMKKAKEIEQKKTKAEQVESKLTNNGVHKTEVKIEKKGGLSCCGIFLSLLVVLSAVIVGLVFYCQANLKDQYCHKGRIIVEPYLIQCKNIINDLSKKYL